MQNEKGEPLIVLMHGDRRSATKNLARAIGTKSVEPCTPEAAERASGYQVGGTSPFATRKAMPVYVESTVLALDRICINGGRRGYLIGIAPRVLTELLGARPGLLRDLSSAHRPCGGNGCMQAVAQSAHDNALDIGSSLRALLIRPAGADFRRAARRSARPRGRRAARVDRDARHARARPRR